MTLRARRTSADVYKKAASIESDAAFLILRAVTASLTAGLRGVFFFGPRFPPCPHVMSIERA